MNGETTKQTKSDYLFKGKDTCAHYFKLLQFIPVLIAVLVVKTLLVTDISSQILKRGFVLCLNRLLHVWLSFMGKNVVESHEELLCFN